MYTYVSVEFVEWRIHDSRQTVLNEEGKLWGDENVELAILYWLDQSTLGLHEVVVLRPNVNFSLDRLEHT